MENIGGAKSSNFQIGVAELRIGNLNDAGRLTSNDSVGLVKNATINVAKTYAELRGGNFNARIHQALTGYDLEINAELYEFTTQNLLRVLGANQVVTSGEVTPDVQVSVTIPGATTYSTVSTVKQFTSKSTTNPAVALTAGVTAAIVSTKLKSAGTLVPANNSYFLPVGSKVSDVGIILNVSSLKDISDLTASWSKAVTISQLGITQAAVLVPGYILQSARDIGIIHDKGTAWTLFTTDSSTPAGINFANQFTITSVDTTKGVATTGILGTFSVGATTDGSRTLTLPTGVYVSSLGASVKYNSATDADNSYMFKMYFTSDTKAVKVLVGTLMSDSAISIKDEGQFPDSAVGNYELKLTIYSTISLAPAKGSEFMTAQLVTKNSFTGGYTYFNLWKVAVQGNLDFSFSGSDYNTLPLKLVSFEPQEDDFSGNTLAAIKADYASGSIFGNIVTD